MGMSFPRRLLFVWLSVIATTPAWADVNQAAARDIARQMKDLYEEMVLFKKSKKFHQLGFAPASPFKKWIDAVKVLDERMKAENLQGLAFFEAGFLAPPNALITIANHYRSSGGQEDAVTIGLTQDLKNTFHNILGK